MQAELKKQGLNTDDMLKSSNILLEQVTKETEEPGLGEQVVKKWNNTPKMFQDVGKSALSSVLGPFSRVGEAGLEAFQTASKKNKDAGECKNQEGNAEIEMHFRKDKEGKETNEIELVLKKFNWEA